MSDEEPVTLDRLRARVLVILAEAPHHTLPTGYACRRIMAEVVEPLFVAASEMDRLTVVDETRRVYGRDVRGGTMSDKLPTTGCACTARTQNAGGGYYEHLLEYEPACPEHSEHIWNPRTGMWELLAEHDRQVKANAWDEGRESVARDFLNPVVDGMRKTSVNPYRADPSDVRGDDE
jgi:hypothetical protein